MSAPIHPEVMYAERSSDTDPEKNFIYLTFRIDDLQPGYKIDLKPESISFAGVSGDPSKGLPEKKWATTLEFYHEIDPENSKEQPYTGRDLLLILRKKDLKKEYWPRLTKQKTSRNFLKTDFDRWADEDEQDEIAGEIEGDGIPGPGGGLMPGMGGGGMDMASLLGGMGGMGGMGGVGGPGGGSGGAGGMDFVSTPNSADPNDQAKMLQEMGGAGGLPNLGDLDDHPMPADSRPAPDEAEKSKTNEE